MSAGLSVPVLAAVAWLKTTANPSRRPGVSLQSQSAAQMRMCYDFKGWFRVKFGVQGLL